MAIRNSVDALYETNVDCGCHYRRKFLIHINVNIPVKVTMA